VKYIYTAFAIPLFFSPYPSAPAVIVFYRSKVQRNFSSETHFYFVLFFRLFFPFVCLLLSLLPSSCETAAGLLYLRVAWLRHFIAISRQPRLQLPRDMYLNNVLIMPSETIGKITVSQYSCLALDMGGGE
jgi:hypothetical protein